MGFKTTQLGIITIENQKSWNLFIFYKLECTWTILKIFLGYWEDPKSTKYLFFGPWT